MWESGLNSAVIFFKLDAIRKQGVVKKVEDLATSKNYSQKIVYIDQDMYNIYFSDPKNFGKC